MKKWYRVNHCDTKQGLWYDFQGKFTGLIHNDYSFCTNSHLQMDFDEELVGYISAVDSLDSLMAWFTKDDILKLQEHGYRIHMYESNNFKFYDRYQHTVIKQDESKLVNVYYIDNNGDIKKSEVIN